MTIMSGLTAPGDRLLTSAEVASIFRVDPKTIARWAREGLIEAIRTPGGRLLRYRESAVRAALLVPAVDARAVAVA